MSRGKIGGLFSDLQLGDPARCVQSLGAHQEPRLGHCGPSYKEPPLGVAQSAAKYHDLQQASSLYLIRREGDMLEATVETLLDQRKIGVR